MADIAAALNNRMNYLIGRQQVVSENIAQSSTPGYKARDIQFASMAQQAQNGAGMQTTHPMHLSGSATSNGSFKTFNSGGDLKLNGNDVDLANETLKLSDIQMQYRMATKLYSKQASMYKLALGKAQ